MRRTFVFSSPIFQGFRVPVDVLAAGSLAGIAAECAQVLCATFRALGTVYLAELAAERAFHVHAPPGFRAAPGAVQPPTDAEIYAAILDSGPSAQFFVCDHDDAPELASSALAELTIRHNGADTVHLCLLSAPDAFACANSICGTASASGTVVDARYFFLTAAKPRSFAGATRARLSLLHPPPVVEEFLRRAARPQN